MTFDVLISGKQIGDRNIFEVRSRLQGDITVQNGCVFGSKTVYTQPGAIPDKTVIYTQVTNYFDEIDIDNYFRMDFFENE